MISKIDGSVAIDIGGEKRRLKFTLGVLEELERYIPGGNVVQINSTGIPPINVLVTATWIGLKYYDKKLKRETVLGWVEEYLQEHDMNDFYPRVIGAIGLTGLLGEKSIFKNMLKDLEKQEQETETEGKPEE